MANHVIAAPVDLIAFSFAPDRRRPWWRRLIQSLSRLGRALAAERRRRRAISGLRARGYGTLLPIGVS